jgi:signal transduction histidine kinase
MEQAAADEAARVAARIGDPDIIEMIAPFLPGGHAVTALRAVETMSELASGIATVAFSAERLSRIVFALRGYTHVVEDEPFREIAVADSLDQALSLFSDAFRLGVTLEKHYDCTGTVSCRPGPLGQIWVNLIQNAIHSMAGIGRLEIRTSRDQNRLKVTIIDSGPGIPPEIQQRIFEPFFTTKRLGDGTGLGLDISRRIVDEHHGTITFESVPGRTRFEVSLPAFGGTTRQEN